PVPRHSRYSPISRRDAARMALDVIPRIAPGRAQCAGGPQTFFSHELDALIAPYKAKTRRGRTRYLSLPPGDVSVDLGTTRATAGRTPSDTLAQALAGEDTELSEPAPRPTVYPKGDPPPHPADSGRGGRVLAQASADLRRVIHAQLVDDLARIGITEDSVTLDFSCAEAGRRFVKAHGGEVPEMRGVRVLSASGEELHVGEVDLLRDKLAEEFRCWWRGEGIPTPVWRDLDMGVRRRLAGDPHFREDPKVRVFLAQNQA
ncbi:MAG: hypothetical protein H6741_35310, partial [Alphaproteobacteria bacterium]|nr:hypothetical protein [Alphaproteobacteria bacterium]